MHFKLTFKSYWYRLSTKYRSASLFQINDDENAIETEGSNPLTRPYFRSLAMRALPFIAPPEKGSRLDLNIG